MNTQDLLKLVDKNQLSQLSKSELIELVLGEQDIRQQLDEMYKDLQEEVIVLKGQYVRIKNKVFLPSSEKKKRRRSNGNSKNANDAGEVGGTRDQLPSERYSNAEIIDKDVELAKLPSCPCCSETMQDSGLTEVTETLTVIPKQYVITRHHIHKYRCSNCYGPMVSAPRLPRIKPGSTYSDAMIISTGCLLKALSS